jgi:katanin p60 ATPase-containing subunit A1
MQSVADAGDSVVLFAPYYFNHYMALQLLNINVVVVPCDPQSFQPRIDCIPWQLPRLRALVLVSPNNPSGVVVSPTLVDELEMQCKRHSVWLVSDETYENFVFGERISHHTPHGEHVVNLYSFSKAFGLAGLRVGYASYPALLHASLMKVQDTIPIAACQQSQLTALRCLRQLSQSWTMKQVATLNANRQQLIELLQRYDGFVRTDGAMFFLIRLPRGMSDVEACTRLAKGYGLLLIPITEASGLLDGSADAHHYIRVSYGNLPPATFIQALKLLELGLDDLFDKKK